MSFFLSYAQKEGAVLAERFWTFVTHKAQKTCWMDFHAKDKSEQGMLEGVKACDVLIAFMTESYLLRPFCQKELLWAQEFGKRVFVVIDAAHKAEITEWRLQCPPSFEWVFEITFANLDASDVRLLEATMPIHLEDALNAPFAPPLQNHLEKVQAAIEFATSDSVPSKADTQVAGAAGNASRLEWLRNAVKQVDTESLIQEAEPELLGKGGQATIEIATYCGKPVALKFYGLRSQDSMSQERAYTEAYLMGAISKLPIGAHHVVPLAGVHTEILHRNINISLVLDLAPQGSLDAIVAGEDVPRFWQGAQDAWFTQRAQYVHGRMQGWISGIAAALRFLHADLKLVHCDIKPANILLFDDGKKPKLTDFGSCILKSKTHWHGSMSLASINNAGFTVRYQAPERIADQTAISPKADNWSFGLIVYEILYGSRAWFEKNDYELSMQKSRDVDALLAASNTAWQPGPQQASAVAVMKQCLLVDPLQRPEMSEIVKLLRSPESVIHTQLVGEDRTHTQLVGEDRTDEPPVEEIKTLGALRAENAAAPTSGLGQQQVDSVIVKGTCDLCHQQVTSVQPRQRTASGQYRHIDCTTSPVTVQAPKTEPREQLPPSFEQPEESVADRLYAFYAYFSVTKPVDEIESIADRHAGRMDELNKKLRQKYFADLGSSNEELAAAKKRVKAQQQVEPIKAKLSAFYKRIGVARTDSDIQNVAQFHVGKEPLLNEKLREKYSADLHSSEQELSSAARLQALEAENRALRSAPCHTAHSPPTPQAVPPMQPQMQHLPHQPGQGFPPPMGMAPMLPYGMQGGVPGMPMPGLPPPGGPVQGPPGLGGAPSSLPDPPAPAASVGDREDPSGLLLLSLYDRENDMSLHILTDIDSLKY